MKIKTTKILILVLGALTVLMACAYVAVSQVQPERTKTVTGADVAKGEVIVEKIDDYNQFANQLFANRIEDINETAKIVNLLKTMGVDDMLGEYTVRISTKRKAEVLYLNAKEPMGGNTVINLNINMRNSAEQLLALMPQIDKIQWSYIEKDNEGREEKRMYSLTAKEATEILGNDVRKYGGTKNNVAVLLKQQAEAVTQ